MHWSSHSVYTLVWSVGVVLITYLIPAVSGSSKFTTVGLPACYIARNFFQNVPGLYERCSTFSQLSFPGRASDFSFYYTFCSMDHECCFHNGFPACCKERTSLNEGEIAGVVIGCMVFVTIVLGLSLYLSKRFCSTNGTD